MNHCDIFPSLLAADPLHLADELESAQRAGAAGLHFDVMDGHFAPNLTVGPPILRAVRQATALPLDVHLMIEKPELSIDSYIDAGADFISVHVEAVIHLHRLLTYIASRNVKAGVVLNPHTPISAIEHVLEVCHFVLIMSVNPGFGGQAFIPAMVPKIERLSEEIRRRQLSVTIEVDGGITRETAPLVYKAGASMLVAGTAVFGQPDRRQAIADIHAACSAS